MKRTVVHFTDSSAIGGTERVIQQLLELTDRDAWRPVLMHHDEPGIAPLIEAAKRLDIPTRAVPRMMTVRDLGKQATLIRALREFEADVFHAHLFWPLSCKYGLIGARRAKVPAVLATAHVRMGLSDRPLLRLQPRLIARAVDRYLAVSQGVADQLVKTFRIPQDKVEVVPNGINIASYKCVRDKALRRQLSGEDDRPVILTAARLSEQKGHRDLIEAASRIDGAVFVFAGDGPLRDGLESQTRSLGISDRVRFLGRRDDVPELLACADLFVLPSLYEGMPLSVLEAMAARVPVIATDIPGNNELVIHGRTGTLAPACAPNKLADAITSALRDLTTARRYADNAYQAVAAQHEEAQVAERVFDAYLRALHNTKAPDPKP